MIIIYKYKYKYKNVNQNFFTNVNVFSLYENRARVLMF